jgi:hypothetical protein
MTNPRLSIVSTTAQAAVGKEKVNGEFPSGFSSEQKKEEANGTTLGEPSDLIRRSYSYRSYMEWTLGSGEEQVNFNYQEIGKMKFDYYPVAEKHPEAAKLLLANFYMRVKDKPEFTINVLLPRVLPAKATQLAGFSMMDFGIFKAGQIIFGAKIRFNPTGECTKVGINFLSDRKRGILAFIEQVGARFGYSIHTVDPGLYRMQWNGNPAGIPLGIDPTDAASKGEL